MSGHQESGMCVFLKVFFKNPVDREEKMNNVSAPPEKGVKRKKKSEMGTRDGAAMVLGCEERRFRDCFGQV